MSSVEILKILKSATSYQKKKILIKSENVNNMRSLSDRMENKLSTIELTYPYEHVALVELNRPAYSNAFNTQMAWELIRLFENFSMGETKTRVIVITGKGKKAFCAGADLKERKGMTNTDWNKQHLIFERMVRALIDCPIPTIGAINGAAFGGGCEIVGALDFVYAAETAKFAQTETKIGIIPGAGGTQTLSRAVGERRAKEIIFTGKPFSAKKASDWGLVNEVRPPDELLIAVFHTAKTIAENAPLAVRQAKQSIHRGLQSSIRDGMAFEIEAYNRTVLSNDRVEGVNAFNQKRKPIFKGD